MYTEGLKLNEEIIAKHTEKLKYWFDLLKEVMPDYFFNTFSPEQIQEMLPSLFNIHRQSGIQQITSEKSVTLIYLKSDINNLVLTARIMAKYNIVGAFIHNSTKPIMIDGVPRTLVIEYYIVNSMALPLKPLYSKKEISKAYRELFGKVPSEVDEIYDRINWDAVRDLSVNKLAERINYVLKVEKSDGIEVAVDKAGKDEIRLTMSLCNCPEKGFYNKIIQCMNLHGYQVHRAYLRDFTIQKDHNDFYHMPVVVDTLYLKQAKGGATITSKNMETLLWDLPHIKWVPMDDIIHDQLVRGKGWSISEANILRAGAEFIHSQFAYIDRNAYNNRDVFRLMLLYEPMLKDLISLFVARFSPKHGKNNNAVVRLQNKINREIENINTGMREKDNITKNIFRALLNFVTCILNERAVFSFT